MIERKRKKIELDKAREVVARFNEVSNPILTARQFVKLHFDEIQQSGKSLAALHRFLIDNGIDVGPFESFRSVYNSEKRGRKKQPIVSTPLEQVPEKLEKKHGTETEPTEKPVPYGLRPIRLADGSEIKIDPETGARVFDV